LHLYICNLFLITSCHEFAFLEILLHCNCHLTFWNRF
jgi:hypothetical protein